MRDAEYHPPSYSDPVADRCIADMALQRWLGLLSERRIGTSVDHINSPIGRRQDMKSLAEIRDGNLGRFPPNKLGTE